MRCELQVVGCMLRVENENLKVKFHKLIGCNLKFSLICGIKNMPPAGYADKGNLWIERYE